MISTKRTAHLFTSVVILILSYFQLSAQTYSNEFLSIGVGARAHGMSGSVVASSGDVFSSYWNPAGLTQVETPLELGFMHAEWFGKVANYDFLGMAKPLNGKNKRVIGISLIRLGIDNIPYTLNLIGADGAVNYNNITQFSAADYALNLAYGQNLNTKLSVGGNLKIVRRTIGSFANAWGVGADLAVQYRTGKWTLAAMGRDITTTYNAWSATLTDVEKQVFTKTNNTIPKSSVEITRPTLILGAAYKTPLGKNFNMAVEANGVLTTDGQRNVLVSSKSFNLDPRMGLEFDYKKQFTLRAGIGNFQKVKNETDPTKTETSVQPNFGVGMNLGRLTVDYALTNIGGLAQVQYSHIFSVKLAFKKKKV
jgi:hypothetical protein